MTKDTFDNLFKAIYGFAPAYEAFNNLQTKNLLQVRKRCHLTEPEVF